MSTETQEIPEGMIDLSEPDAIPKKDTRKFMTVDVVAEGDKILLPTGMSYKTARAWLDQREKEAEEEVSVSEIVRAYPLDGAVAFMKALKRKFGWASLVPTPGFWGPTPPVLMGIKVGYNQEVQVPWGSVAIPGITGTLQTGVAVDNGRPVFQISGTTKQKYKKAVQEIAALTREIVRAESIYRGKAIKVSSVAVNPRNFNPQTDGPDYIDTSAAKRSELIFPANIERLVEVALFTPIERTAECRAHGVPLKRGVLLEGPFGTGKTLTANVTAKLCEDHDWTFVYLTDVEQLDQALQFAKEYAPAVIFAEDIDRIAKERDDALNAILNTIDGVDMKDKEILVVLTTNHVEKIDRSLLRPGRLDAVVPVRAPDPVAVDRLIRLYGRGLVEADADLTAVGGMLAGQIPAVIREVVERSKLAAISRMIPGDTLVLKAQDLEDAADGMLQHLNLLKEAKVDERSDAIKAAEIYGQAVGKAFEHVVEKTEEVKTIVDRSIF